VLQNGITYPWCNWKHSRLQPGRSGFESSRVCNLSLVCYAFFMLNGICEECGGGFPLTRGNRRFCKASCRTKNFVRNNPRITLKGQTLRLQCEACGHAFEYEKQRGRLRKYCSEDCKRVVMSAVYERRRILKRYGITQEDWDRMAADQGGRCAICRTSRPSGRSSKWWDVDHCSATGRVRGLLCGRCNKGIGLLQHDPVILQAATDYVLRNRA
jgi:hypothetical protein